jgi:hypothetical protein
VLVGSLERLIVGGGGWVGARRVWVADEGSRRMRKERGRRRKARSEVTKKVRLSVRRTEGSRTSSRRWKPKGAGGVSQRADPWRGERTSAGGCRDVRIRATR